MDEARPPAGFDRRRPSENSKSPRNRGQQHDQKPELGLLSTAHINEKLMPAIRGADGHRLYGVASRDAERAQDYASEWGIPHAYGSYEALLADEHIDVVYNALPNHLHAAWTIKAAEAGKHVLCEKPIALNPQEVDAIAAAAAKNQVVVMGPSCTGITRARKKCASW
jgi:predicted dehydrogenase